ncbi:hypothetical protein VCHC50A1_1467, partial [Vibrio cholerae HC-50A1]
MDPDHGIRACHQNWPDRENPTGSAQAPNRAPHQSP